MRVSARNRDIKSISRQLLLQLDKLRKAVSFPHETWACFLQLSPSDYEKLLSGKKQLPFYSLVNISEQMQLDMDALIENKVDYKALSEHYSGHLDYIPEKYMIGAFSKKRSIRNVLDFVEGCYGSYQRFQTMRYLQIKPKGLEDLDENININLAVDAFDFLSRRGADKEFFKALGRNSILQTLNLPFAHKLAQSKDIPELYHSYLEEQVFQLEKNSIYRYLPVSEEKFIVEALLNEEVSEALKRKKYGSKEICMFKTGGLENLTRYAGFKPTKVDKLSCIHQGDQVCRWQVAFDSKNLKPQLSSPESRLLQ